MNLELLTSLTILYAEDESSLQEDIFQNISPFVKKIYRADDGQEGLKIFREKRDEIDLIVSDILMPNMNGIEMIDAIRESDAEIPIIYTTAFNDSEYMKKTIEQGVVSYIIKPIDIELLLKGIEKASFKIENVRLKATLEQINQELEKKIELKTKELKEQNKKLYTQLYTDSLTSLPNRKALIRDMQKFQNPVLAIVDIDSFKSINDLYGEHIGNIVLKSTSKLLKKLLKDEICSIYRIGADTFALMKDADFDRQECVDKVTSVIATIDSKPIDIKEYSILIKIAVTLGISSQKIDTLETADMALKKAKANRLSYLIYSEEHNLDREYQNDIKWTRIIEKAIESDTVVSYYQPILNRDGDIVKYEALIRILEDDNIYSPFLFLDISKKVKFYNKLEHIVILKAFKKARESLIPVSINISIEDILNVEFLNFIESEFKKGDIAKLVTFELLESESITDYEKVISFIDKMKAYGSKIAIDDFGSGYSNFTYLLKLKPDYIKIDGSSVKNIHRDKNSYLITKTINDFAHSLGIKTIAEYVHCKEVYDILESLGVDEYQGYFFSEPLEDF
jgi:diguanylate cyclase (GGDEF)-like protein